MKISNELQHRLICPVTKAKLNHQDDYLQSAEDSSIRYPLIGGIPILINNEKSLFQLKTLRIKFIQFEVYYVYED